MSGDFFFRSAKAILFGLGLTGTLFNQPTNSPSLLESFVFGLGVTFLQSCSLCCVCFFVLLLGQQNEV